MFERQPPGVRAGGGEWKCLLPALQPEQQRRGHSIAHLVYITTATGCFQNVFKTATRQVVSKSFGQLLEISQR